MTLESQDVKVMLAHLARQVSVVQLGLKDRLEHQEVQGQLVTKVRQVLQDPRVP